MNAGLTCKPDYNRKRYGLAMITEGNYNRLQRAVYDYAILPEKEILKWTHFCKGHFAVTARPNDVYLRFNSTNLSLITNKFTTNFPSNKISLVKYLRKQRSGVRRKNNQLVNKTAKNERY